MLQLFQSFSIEIEILSLFWSIVQTYSWTMAEENILKQLCKNIHV